MLVMLVIFWLNEWILFLICNCIDKEIEISLRYIVNISMIICYVVMIL